MIYPLLFYILILYPENSKPIWHKKSKCISVSPDFSEVKPSFRTGCYRINEIKPEIIAQNILDQLGILKKLNLKQSESAQIFHKRVEIVPNFYQELSDQLKEPLKFAETYIGMQKI